MFVQFVGDRDWIISRKNIKQAVRGVTDFSEDGEPGKAKDCKVHPGAVVDLEETFAKKLVKDYPGDCIAYGVEAIKEAEKAKEILKKKTGGKKSNKEGDENALDTTSSQ